MWRARPSSHRWESLPWFLWAFFQVPPKDRETLLNKGRCKNCMLFLGLSEVIWKELDLSSPADNINLSHRLQKLNFLAREISLHPNSTVFSVSLGQPYSSPHKLPTSSSLFPEMWIAPTPATAPCHQSGCIEGNLGNPIYQEANQRAPCHASQQKASLATQIIQYMCWGQPKALFYLPRGWACSLQLMHVAVTEEDHL